MEEMYGDAGSYAQSQMGQGLLNGATFHTPFTSGEQSFVVNNRAPFAYFAIPDSAGVGSCYPSASDDANAGNILSSLTQSGLNVWRLGMPEFDQGGGCWANGRPSMGGLSDAQAYSTWINYYLNTKGLSSYLSQSAAQRGYKWMSVSSYVFSVQYAFDLGVDAALLERNEDEMSGMTPGLAMIRGAAKQHGGKDWGIDFSTWRYWDNNATTYSSGKMVSGWSTSTFKRHYYMAYMGGANIIHNEAVDYYAGAASGSSLNPLGQTVQQFYGFAVTRHPNRGTPYVPAALMEEHTSGFEPKFGEWMQVNGTWYWQNGYTQGDQFFANLLSVVYPGYNTWGTLPSGSPKVLNGDGSINVDATFSSYQQALAQGADPRPWEPFGNSRWGETFDIITNQASLAALQKYRFVILATGVPMTSSLLSTISQYVQQGGTVVLNAKQLNSSAESLTGLHLTGGTASASSSLWMADGSQINDSSFNYALSTPTSASVVAQSSGNPIITKNAYGSGLVYVTTPDFMANSGSSQILSVGQKLLDTLSNQYAVVRISGPQLEYLVNTDGRRVIVTLVNTALNGSTWNGTLYFALPSVSYSVKEWTSDTTVASSVSSGQVVVNASVPAYDVRVYVLDVQ